jgi:hypothetical protein
MLRAVPVSLGRKQAPQLAASRFDSTAKGKSGTYSSSLNAYFTTGRQAKCQATLLLRPVRAAQV